MVGRQQAAGRSCKETHLKGWPASLQDSGDGLRRVSRCHLSALAWKCLVKVLLTAHWPEGVTRGPKGMCDPPRHLCLTTLPWGPEGGDTALHRDLREKSPLPWESEGGDSELSWRWYPLPHTLQLPWKN